MAGHGTDSKSQATPTKAPKSPKVAKRGKLAKVSKAPKRAKTAPLIKAAPITKTDTDCAAWQPSPKHLRLLAAFEDKGYDCKIADVCKAARICRRTYYLWHQNPEFSEWWAYRVNRYFTQALHRVHVATLDAATTKGQAGGSTADRKLFYERFDKAYRPAADAAASAPAPVTVRVDVVEAMREMIEGVAARALAAGGDCFSAPLGLPCDRAAAPGGDVVDVEPVTAEEEDE